MSVFRGNDREIDFEEEDTLAQYPELYESPEEVDSKERALAEYKYEKEAREQEEDTALHENILRTE